VLFMSLFLTVIGSQTRTHESGMATVSDSSRCPFMFLTDYVLKQLLGELYLECFRPLQDL
jgi:hypothetical protein